jgi:hypothetical protein
MMHPYKRIMLAAAMAGVLLAPGVEVWAAGTGSTGGDGDCVVPKVPKNALKATGTMGVEVSGPIFDQFQSQDVDVTFRVERRNVTKFFRVHLQYPVVGVHKEVIACNALDVLATQILDANNGLFTYQEITNRNLTKIVITDDSIRNDESGDANTVIPGTVVGSGTGATGRAASVADIVIYAAP